MSVEQDLLNICYQTRSSKGTFQASSLTVWVPRNIHKQWESTLKTIPYRQFTDMSQTYRLTDSCQDCLVVQMPKLGIKGFNYHIWHSAPTLPLSTQLSTRHSIALEAGVIARALHEVFHTDLASEITFPQYKEYNYSVILACPLAVVCQSSLRCEDDQYNFLFCLKCEHFLLKCESFFDLRK